MKKQNNTGTNKFSGLLILAAALCIAFLMPLKAEAAINASNFDNEAYAEMYPDLKAAFGTDATALYNHYVTSGKAEGRVAKIKPIERISLFAGYVDENYYFDYERYAQDYPDLAAAFGVNKELLWNHYKNNGEAEGRVAYATTDAKTAELLVYDTAMSITNEAMTDVEKLQTVHDWIINNTSYDYDNYLAGSIPWASYGVEGVMLNHTAVCQGYAETFELFCDVLGIECEMVTGRANGGGHAWNRVNLDGTWYEVDVTWDDPIYWYNGVRQEVLRYTYFLISKEQMAQDHTETTY
ncbi:MAG: hypothetical protein K6G23_05300 [Lachnospiraceae bacterium]|nr:hypothetical protein [Lachnospiraceae bacterium]